MYLNAPAISGIPVKTEVPETQLMPVAQVEEVSNKISTEQLQTLEHVFTVYGEICRKFGPLSAEELDGILPNEWSSIMW